jgi:outer membrane protein assembly factor BamB
VKRPRTFAAGLVLVLVALLAAGCGGIVNPQGWASPALNGPTVYYFPSKDRLAAVALTADGSPSISAPSWSFPDKARQDQKDIKIDAVYGSPVLDGDVTYFAAYDGDVFAVNLDGTLKWELKGVQGSIVGGPVLSGGLLAFGTTEGRLYVINKSDHSPAPGWPKDGMKLGNGIWAAPAIQGDAIIVATMGGTVSAFRLSDGSPAWDGKSFRAGGAVADLQLLDDGHLFAPSLNKHVYILNPANGAEVVDFKASDWVWTRAAYRDNVAYFGDFAGKVYALDITNGQLKWNQPYETHSEVKAAPAIVDDVLVLADRKPVVHLIDLNSGASVNTVPILTGGTVRADVLPYSSKLQGPQAMASPVAQADRGLIVTTKGKLYIADPKAKTVTEVLVAGAKP